eukprot:2663-Heterococcus_DN1.PRE.4
MDYKKVGESGHNRHGKAQPHYTARHTRLHKTSITVALVLQLQYGTCATEKAACGYNMLYKSSI